LEENQTLITKFKTMRKIVLVYGGIAGAIVASMFVITMPLYKSGALNMDNGEVIGYTSMVIALSMIFFGIKSYRDQHLMGSISFWKAFQVGILIALIAGLIYAVSWEIYFNLYAPDFMQQYAATSLAKAKAKGLSVEEIQRLSDRMDQMIDLYRNPLWRFLFTLMEILPVGLAITLISAAILRKKEILPA
jgi:Protein of unknown function (DUF4199)